MVSHIRHFDLRLPSDRSVNVGELLITGPFISLGASMAARDPGGWKEHIGFMPFHSTNRTINRHPPSTGTASSGGRHVLNAGPNF